MNGQKVVCIKAAAATSKFCDQHPKESQQAAFYIGGMKNLTALERVRLRATSCSMPNMQILAIGNGHVINRAAALQSPCATISCASPLPKKLSPTLVANDFSCISLVDDELPDHFDNDQAFLCDFLEHNQDESVTMATRMTTTTPATTMSATNRSRSGLRGHRCQGVGQVQKQNDQRLVGNLEVDEDDDEESSTRNLHNSLNFYPPECRLVDPVAWTLNCRVFVPIVS